MRATWILADAHGGADRDADRELFRFFELAARAEVDLLILGDLFAAWIAIERFFTPLQREVVARLESLRARGAGIAFVSGNRDYLAKMLEGTVFDRVVEDEELIELGGVSTLVSHGDLANEDDKLYRLWRSISKSRLAGRAISTLPSSLGRALAARAEQALRGTNAAYKTGDLPIRALEALGRRAESRGARRALVGHFHHDRVLDVAGGAPVIVAPGWIEHRRILRVDPASGALSSVPFAALETIVG